MCITYFCVVNFHTLESMKLSNSNLLSFTEVSLEKLEGKFIEAEQDRQCVYNIIR